MKEVLQHLYDHLILAAKVVRRYTLDRKLPPPRAIEKTTRAEADLDNLAREYVEAAMQFQPETNWADWLDYNRRFVKPGIDLDPHQIVADTICTILKERDIEILPKQVDWFSAIDSLPQATKEQEAAHKRWAIETNALQLANPPEWWRKDDDAESRAQLWKTYRDEQKESVWNNRGRKFINHPDH